MNMYYCMIDLNENSDGSGIFCPQAIELLNIIKKSYSNVLFDVNKLSEESGITRQRIHVIITDNFCITPIELIKRVRLENAIMLLKKESNIYDVLKKTGFYTNSNFKNSCLDYFNETPKSIQVKFSNVPDDDSIIEAYLKLLWEK